MNIQQLVPWASLVASILTVGYAGLKEWRRTSRDDESQFRGRPTLGSNVSSAVIFLFITLPMLFVAGLSRYVLVVTSVTDLIVPVWMLALFVILVVGLVRAMPGDTFEEKVEQFTVRPGSDVDVDVSTSSGNRDATAGNADERPEK